MPEFRSRKDEIAYFKWRKVNKKSECLFCEVGPGHEQYIKSSKSFNFVKNIYPYSLWDSMGVSEHILLAPFKHVDSISTFSQVERDEYMGIISDYEKDGYNIYARGRGSGAKSIIHQHTHLIKLDGKKKTFIFYLAKPFIRLAR